MHLVQVSKCCYLFLYVWTCHTFAFSTRFLQSDFFWQTTFWDCNSQDPQCLLSLLYKLYQDLTVISKSHPSLLHIQTHVHEKEWKEGFFLDLSFISPASIRFYSISVVSGPRINFSGRLLGPDELLLKACLLKIFWTLIWTTESASPG